MRTNKIISGILSVALVFGAMAPVTSSFIGLDSCTVQAESYFKMGKFGDNLSWSFNDEGILTISGTGDMYDFDDNSNISPFADNIYVNKIVIEDGVTSIGDYAFPMDMSVSEISIPDSVERIGSCAFFGCTDMVKADIPENVSYIGDHAFYFCQSLEEVNIPDALTRIEDNTFVMCSSLQSINIPDSIQSIGSGAFMFCTGAQTLEGMNNVTNIGEGAFAGCTYLTEAFIPECVEYVGESAFAACGTFLSPDELQDPDLEMPESVFTMWCKKGSAAETYATDNQVNYYYTDLISEVTFKDPDVKVNKPLPDDKSLGKFDDKCYTGTISWSSDDKKAEHDTMYTATITFTAKDHYLFDYMIDVPDGWELVYDSDTMLVLTKTFTTPQKPVKPGTEEKPEKPEPPKPGKEEKPEKPETQKPEKPEPAKPAVKVSCKIKVNNKEYSCSEFVLKTIDFIFKVASRYL